ncbi:uncharacterized protein LOC118644383 isoform X2 [Monomorium pharaonis]|uniref:uncharacterized protein LOC118644383 isoform X2 n=1 Tax=Monomorium pharaonis TaxID=307658 RepID=UPI0017460061|nr:uncharacterized protein LOC118644383 isoform X2 [Monomorium pharaonis]
MYLIECDDDASLCIVEDHEIICDDESVQIGNIVQFVYQKKLYEGKIIMHSDNITILREEVKKLGAKKMINKTQSDIILSETRIRKKPKIYSPNGSDITQEKLPNKRKLKRNDYSCNKQRDINALKIINNNSLESFDKNVTTVKQLPNKSSIQEINCRDNLRLISDENSTSSEEERLSENEKQEVQYSRNNDDCKEIYDPVIAAAKMLTKPDQLYGKYWPHEPMILLINDVYCRKRIWMSALGNSKAVTHLARRLIVGVFKKEKLLKCTLSGQPPRAQGKERQNEEIEGLDVRAKDAIIDYAILMGESKNWNVPDRRVIERSMTQQIGRLKLELKQALVREQD